MAKDCTYRFTDRDGKERVIKGQAAFKAYLASGGLEHLLPSAPVALSARQKPEFYSQLSRVIGGVPDRLATMPAQQWKAWIESNSAKLGVKKDEIEWSGIKDYLDLRGKDKVTRADLVDYLDQNGVRVTETVLGSGGLNAAEKAELDDLNRRYQDYEREVSGAVFDAGDFDRLQELEQNGERKGLAQYGQYTLPGGENYRELLLMLPIKEKPTWLKFLGKRDLTLDMYEELPVEDRRSLTAEYMELESETYDTPHWAENNVLAHIRLNNRTDADDKRVLFVEEVQSDWGQQGKKSGFANAALRAELKKEIRALGIKKSLMNISIRDLKEFGADADLQDRFREEMLTGSMKVLPAPFIGKTEGWLNLALKRITMMAVEGGYDKVAFVNGDQSAERYDLSKHVSRIEYEPTGDGKYEIVAIDKSDNRVIDEAGVDISRVEELIGKDLASKIAGNEGRLQQPGKWVVFDGNEKLFESESERDAREYASVADGKPEVRQISGWDNDRRVLSGLDLKVGGEGMKTFYDQIVPQNLNKLLPKIGGAKMGTVEMVTDTGRYKGPVSGEDVMDALGIRANRQYNYWANLNQAERDKLVEDYRQGEVTAMTQPGFDVTDSMRETVGQGLPMFSRAQDLTPEDVLKPETIAAAEAAIAKYKKAEPPDPLTKKERALGEKLLQPLYDGAKRNKPEFDKTLDRIGEEVNGYAKKPGIKKPYRAVTKLAIETFWKTGEIKDLLRGTIVVNTLEEAQDAINKIGKVYDFDRIKNRLLIDLTNVKGETVQGKPLPTGYQDVLTNVVLPDGTVAEIQISTPEMLAAKHLGHEIYAFEREMPDSPVKTKMVELQKKIYSEGLGAYEGRAAKAVNTRSNSALSTGSAFSRTSEGLRGSGSGPQAVAERQPAETVTGTPFQSKNMVPGGRDLKSNVIGTSAPIIAESIGINVNQDGENRYADKIVDGEKTLETRASDSLRPYVGKRVSIVRTGDGPAKAIGAVTIGEPIRVSTQKQFDQYRDQTLVPKGSKFDIAPGQVKYMYPLENPVRYATERNVGLGIVARKVEPPSRAEQKNAAASRVEGTSAERFKRTPELQQAVADLQAGNITRDEYNRMVDESRPVYPYAAVPDVTTPKDARYALANGRGQSAEKAAKYGVPTMTLTKGDWAQLRLDIPSYQEHDTWVVSVHTPKSTNREVQTAYDAGPVVGYESVAALTDVTFGMNQKMAARIATGTAKGTIATMLGKWSPISKADAKARADAALNDPAWTQVGMDPFRHSYFYDRDTMRPVLAADEVIQVGPLVLAKNVTFGQEADITGAPIAFAKRQPMGKETEGWLLSRDELGRFRFGAGAKAYRYAADVANAVLDVVAMKPVSPELSRAMRKMRMEVDKAQNLTVEVAKTMKDLPDQERQMISDVIEGELKRGAKPPKRVLEIAASMQDIMSEQSAELVRLGMLSKDAAGRWDGKYLPRFYEQKLGDETKAWMKAVKGLLGRKQTMQGIKGSSLKARGMFETVPVADLADWEAEGWAVRDATYDPAVDTEITVWRDYTRTERDDMGEIRDAMFRFVMGYNKSQRDIALGRLYENLATNYASKTEQPGYVQVPATNVEDTFAKRYGKLAGKWVPFEILDQLTAFDTTMQDDLAKIYLKGMSMWKEGKTVLNPVAHANNVMSNVTMAHFAGVSYWDAHKYIGSIKDLVKGDPMVDEAREAGLFGGTFNRAELTDAMPEELKVLAQMAESKSKRAVEMVWNGLSLWLRKPLGKAYNAEDEFFRYVIYRDARNKGLSVDDSVDYALKYMFSYDDMPKGARFLRDMPLGLPFFSYTYKVVPALANTALEHPFRYAAPAVAIYTVNAIMYSIAASLGGGEDEDWWTIIRRYMTDSEFRQRTKDLEKQERENLPPWQKGASLALGTEKTIRLGMDDLTNLPVFLDVSRIFPGGDLFDAHNNAGGIPLLAPITPNSPVLTIAAAMLFNKDTFRGQDVVKKTDTDAEAAQKRAAWMWKQMTPAIAVGNTHFERAMNVIANVTGQPVNVGLAEYTGIGKDGLPITPGYAALQTVGIKARPIDLDTSEKIQKAQTKALIRELEMQIKQSQRLENKGAISPTTGEAEREKLREKKQFIRQGLTVEGEEKD